MGTWYVDEYTYHPNFTKEYDEMIHSPAMFDQALGLGARSSLFAARVHGNPGLESMSIGWQESPARMREQDEVYKGAVLSGNDAFGFEKIFSKMPDVWDRTGGFHVIDADDEMLNTEGEAYVHRQFTDYMAEHVCATPEESDAWDDLVRSYLYKNFFNNLAQGVIPGTVVVEPIRQLLGFPYEWHGPPVD